MPASLPKTEHVRVIETLGPTAQGFSFALEESEERVQIRALHLPDYGPIYADWLGNEVKRRIAAGRNQLVARAVGMRKSVDLKILDCTAGLGRDSFTLAALGAQVTMTERHPMIFALLQDAKKRVESSDQYAAAIKRVELLNCDAADVINREAWDVIYLDPMYEHQGRTALPQKEMQIFHDLTVGAPDATPLLVAARNSNSKRTVVKRAAKAECLGNIKPDLELAGSQARFDIYLKKEPIGMGKFLIR
ncbi:MAG: class I SAM-dependent methyltransferase [Pseudomonadota bacterium]